MILTSLMLSTLLLAQDGGLDSAARPGRSFGFLYTAELAKVPAGAAQVRLWVPIPLDTPDQEISNLVVRASGGSTEVERIETAAGAEGRTGALRWSVRDIRNGFGRSLCLETPGAPIRVELAFDVRRYETKGGGEATPEELARLRRSNRLIPLDGKVRAVAASLRLPDDPLAAARELYDHTLERMSYAKPEGGGWGRGDAEWACDARFGNCTDFHSYFMGLARARGLATRFEMGFPVPAGGEKETEIGGYHCWAYFWADERGWVPVDISEADKHPEKSDYFFGTLDADRVTITGGRDLVLDPAPAEGPLNFFVYPHAEIDGQPVDVTRSFRRTLE